MANNAPSPSIEETWLGPKPPLAATFDPDPKSTSVVASLKSARKAMAMMGPKSATATRCISAVLNCSDEKRRAHTARHRGAAR